ncbi:MAG: COG1361 S-layer family protein [Candidatus Woesearchaeota archaeon]
MKKIIIMLLVFFLMISGVSAAVNLKDNFEVSLSVVNQDPDPATAGDIVEIRIGVENIGGLPGNNALVELIPQYPFGLISGQDAIQEIGTLNAYQYDDNMKIVKYKLMIDKDAIAGSYEFKVKYYEKGSNTSISITKSLFLDVDNKESAEVIYIDQVELIPGKITPLKFTINNVGSAPLRKLSFQWENENNIILPVGSDNTRYIKYIDVGDGVELQFNVIASTSVDPDLYMLDLTLTYDDPVSGEEKEINTKAGVYVGGETDFDVAFSENSNGGTSFTIANIGSNPASSVSVTIPIQKAWRVSGSNSVVIGNLNKGDYTVASFNLQSGTSAMTTDREASNKAGAQDVINPSPGGMSVSNSKNLLVQIAYTDTMGERHIVEKDVQLSSQVTSTATMPGESQTEMMTRMHPTQQSVWKNPKIIGPIITAIIVIGGIILYYTYKKKKLIEPGFKLKDLIKKKKR